MPKFEDVIPMSLKRRAFATAHEFAWDRGDALRVIDIVEANGFTVLGIEIWIPGKNGPIIPMPYFYSWDASDPGDGHATAKEFVKTFAWDPQDEGFRQCEPFFNLTVDDD